MYKERGREEAVDCTWDEYNKNTEITEGLEIIPGLEIFKNCKTNGHKTDGMTRDRLRKIIYIYQTAKDKMADQRGD